MPMSPLLARLACLLLLARASGAQAAPQAHPGQQAPSVPGLETLPLAPRPAAAEGPRFRAVPADESGLDFVHHWRPEPAYLDQLGNAMAGGGVALGDLDQDGLPELLLTRPFGGARLYHNDGGLKFADMSAAAGTLSDAWSGGASFGDLDDDGRLELYVCGYDVPNRLYWNAGSLPLREGAAEAGLAFDGASVMMSFADFDLDGDLDGYLLTNRVGAASLASVPPPGPDGVVTMPPDLVESFDVLQRPDGQAMYIAAAQFDHLYRNDGRGHFEDVSGSAGLRGNYHGLSATWWDPDDDGFPDLYVANDFFGPDQLYMNQRDGRFQDVAAGALPHTPWFSMGSDAGDLDGDLLQDFVASDMLGTTHERRAVTMTDLSEGRWFLEAAEPRQYMRNAVYLNTGTGRFSEVAMTAGLARSDWTWSTVLGDLDADRRLDLFVSNGMTRDYFHYDRRAEAATHGEIMSGYWAHQPLLAEANLAFRNEADLQFRSVGPAWGLDHVAASFGALLGDLDRDGDLDVVCNDFEAPVALFENRSAVDGPDGGHVLAIELRGRAANAFGLGARVLVSSRRRGATHEPATTQVRHLTLAHGFMAGHEPRLHFGLGDHDLVERLEVRWPGDARAQVFAGLEVDRAYRISEPEAGDEAAAAGAEPTRTRVPPSEALFALHEGPRSPEQPFDDFVQQPLLPARLSRLGPGLACGDVDGDGDDDLYLGGSSGQVGRLLSAGDGRLAERAAPGFLLDDYYEDLGALFLDVDADGDLDLYVTSGGNEALAGSRVYADRLYINDGHGGFKRAPQEALPESRESDAALAAADLDGDGDLELFVGARCVPGAWPAGGSSRLLATDGGKLVDATAALAPELAGFGRITAALFCDVDDDGDSDLALAQEWGPLRLLRHEGGRLVDDSAAAGLLPLTGWWNSLCAGDVDHDGDLDLVAGNLGFGSRTQPAPGQPAVLLHGDLDGSGTLALLETEWVDGQLVPLRPRNDVLAALPILGADFPTHASWAAATLQDLFGAEALAAAGRLEATTAASGWLANDGAGHFSFEPLPRRAQIAPVHGLALTEVDGDGHPDLLLVQNSFSPQAEHGRLDGGLGLVLLGDGRGGWQPLRADRSGFVVPGDARSLALLDVDADGRADAVVGVNDGPLLLAQRRDGPPGALLAVRLAGPPGNPASAGARLRFEVPGLPPQTVELAAGSGHLGQSAPVAFFGWGAAPDPSAMEDARLVVRWPGGASSEHAVPRGTSTLQLAAP